MLVFAELSMRMGTDASSKASIARLIAGLFPNNDPRHGGPPKLKLLTSMNPA